jgi:phosphotransferase system HPr (HPr) family protein
MNPDPIPTCKRAVVVKIENGLHLGPSSQIVQIAQRFTSTLVIRKGDKKVDGKSMLDLLTLAAEHGTVLELETSGVDAAEALEAVAGLFERNFATDQPSGPPDKTTPGAV